MNNLTQTSDGKAQEAGISWKFMSVRVPLGLYGRLRKFAFVRDMSHQDVIHGALREYLNAHEEEREQLDT